jgi:hypothetical protein
MKYPVRVELNDGPMLVFEDGHLEPVGDVNIVPGPDPIAEMDASEEVDLTPDPPLGRPMDDLDELTKNQLLERGRKVGATGFNSVSPKAAIIAAIRAVK